MSKKRNKNNDSAGIWGLIIIAILAILILAPIFILGYNIYLVLTLKQNFSNATPQISDFWLDELEKNEYISSLKGLSYESEIIDSAHQAAKENNIAINKDGSYSKRSNMGKQVCAILAEHMPLLTRYKTTIKYLENLPQARWNKFTQLLSHAKSCVLALVSWFVFYSILCFYYQLNAIDTFIYYITLNSNEHMIFIISGLASIIIFFISDFFVRKKINATYCPVPLVNKENYNAY